MSELHSDEEICEALLRHMEVSGHEVFEKNFVKQGETHCTVWCVVGSNAEKFRCAVIRWLDENGFKADY